MVVRGVILIFIQVILVERKDHIFKVKRKKWSIIGSSKDLVDLIKK